MSYFFLNFLFRCGQHIMEFLIYIRKSPGTVLVSCLWPFEWWGERKECIFKNSGNWMLIVYFHILVAHLFKGNRKWLWIKSKSSTKPTRSLRLVVLWCTWISWEISLLMSRKVEPCDAFMLTYVLLRLLNFPIQINLKPEREDDTNSVVSKIKNQIISFSFLRCLCLFPVINYSWWQV